MRTFSGALGGAADDIHAADEDALFQIPPDAFGAGLRRPLTALCRLCPAKPRSRKASSAVTQAIMKGFSYGRQNPAFCERMQEY